MGLTDYGRLAVTCWQLAEAIRGSQRASLPLPDPAPVLRALEEQGFTVTDPRLWWAALVKPPDQVWTQTPWWSVIYTDSEMGIRAHRGYSAAHWSMLPPSGVVLVHGWDRDVAVQIPQADAWPVTWEADLRWGAHHGRFLLQQFESYRLTPTGEWVVGTIVPDPHEAHKAGVWVTDQQMALARLSAALGWVVINVAEVGLGWTVGATA